MSILLLTGLSGSGKSTLAKSVSAYLTSLGRENYILDGDVGRETYSKDLGFSIFDRLQNNVRAASVASFLESLGAIVLVSYISPTKEMRNAYYKLCKNVHLVWVNCDIDICVARDPKGMYSRLIDGKLNNIPFTGMHKEAQYIEPTYPDLIIDTSNKPLQTSRLKLIKYIKESVL